MTPATDSQSTALLRSKKGLTSRDMAEAAMVVTVALAETAALAFGVAIIVDILLGLFVAERLREWRAKG